jgi:hypothetical protein
MTNSQTAPRFGTWKTARSLYVIEYDLEVLRRIQRDVASAYSSLAHGGLETGGFLLGTVSGNLVRIDGFERFQSEHAYGPSFKLSEKDHYELARSLAELAGETAPVGQRVVGWYRSRTRNTVSLTPDDLSIHDRYFPEAWHVVLVVRPLSSGAARAAFFLREPGGLIAATPDQEFQLEADSHVNQLTVRQSGPLMRHPGPMTFDPWNTATPQFLLPVEEQSGRRVGWGVWGVLAAVLSLALGALLYLRTYLAPSTKAVQPLRVEAVEHNGNIKVSWDTTAASGASRGLLDVQDGALRAQLILDRSTLAAGSVSYASRSDVTGFRLRIERNGSAPLEGSFTFIAPPMVIERASVRQPVTPAATPQPPLFTRRPTLQPVPAAAQTAQPRLAAVGAAPTRLVRIFQLPESPPTSAQPQTPTLVDTQPPALQSSAQVGLNASNTAQLPNVGPPPAAKSQPMPQQPVQPQPTAAAPSKPAMHSTIRRNQRRRSEWRLSGLLRCQLPRPGRQQTQPRQFQLRRTHRRRLYALPVDSAQWLARPHRVHLRSRLSGYRRGRLVRGRFQAHLRPHRSQGSLS